MTMQRRDAFPHSTRMRFGSMTAALAILLVFSAPQTGQAQDAPSADLIEKGRVLFEEATGDIGCAVCHGPDARGDIGPDIRGKVAALVRVALETVPDMSDVLELDDEEIEAVSAYLQSLGSQPTLQLDIASAESTPETDAQLAEGKKIFEETAGGIGCAACHGLDGRSGEIGPPNAGASEAMVSNALESVPEMRAIIDLNHTELKAVVAYLDYLGKHTEGPLGSGPINRAFR